MKIVQWNGLRKHILNLAYGLVQYTILHPIQHFFIQYSISASNITLYWTFYYPIFIYYRNTLSNNNCRNKYILMSSDFRTDTPEPGRMYKWYVPCCILFKDTNDQQRKSFQTKCDFGYILKKKTLFQCWFCVFHESDIGKFINSFKMQLLYLLYCRESGLLKCTTSERQ